MYQVPCLRQAGKYFQNLDCGGCQNPRLPSFAACLPTGRLGVFARENQGIPPAPLAIQDAGTQVIHHFIPINYF
jgi:hypothetical protein